MKIKQDLIIGKNGVLRGLNGLHGFYIDGNIVNISEKVKDLGVIIDKHMNSNEQMNGIVKVARLNL